jgi:hypothetical protein
MVQSMSFTFSTSESEGDEARDAEGKALRGSALHVELSAL